MNRHDALQFIRDNSRLLREAELGRFKIEYRIGNNGTSFFLMDMHEDGWEIYFNAGGNNIARAMTEFGEKTECKIP
jgi:hypothetical protein